MSYTTNIMLSGYLSNKDKSIEILNKFTDEYHSDGEQWKKIKDAGGNNSFQPDVYVASFRSLDRKGFKQMLEDLHAIQEENSKRHYPIQLFIYGELTDSKWIMIPITEFKEELI